MRAPLLLGGTRTQAHCAQLSVLNDAWIAYNQCLTFQPLITKAITAGIIIGAGDAAAQLIAKNKGDTKQKSFDTIRATRWAIFGLILQGPWNHFFYLLLDSALPPTQNPFTLTTLEKVTIDQGVQAPIFTIVILYFFAIVEGKGLEYATAQVREDLGDILVKNWSVFLPATFINLAFCPPELRVLFLNTVFFGWVVYLSLFLNDEGD